MARLFQIQTHVRSMIDDDGAVLLDLKAGKYYSLNQVAAAVWTGVEQERDASDIFSELAKLYGISIGQVQSDVRELISGLETMGLVHVGA